MIAKGGWLLGLVSLPLYAMDLGVFGQTYPILEFPADKLIEQRLQSISPEQKQAIEKQWLAKAEAKLMRPSGFSLPRATKKIVRLFNPSTQFPEDILDANGKVIIPKQTKVNPLDYVSLSRPLVFFDGDDKAQIEWVKRHYLDGTLILIQGEPLTLEAQWNRKVFFDQGGKLRHHFTLTALPSVVIQDGKRLRIEECDPL